MKDDGWQRIMLWGSFIFFLGALLLRQEAGINQDLGRHLRLGEMILAGGESRKCALYSNCLAYTHPDYPFVNHHWGSEVIFYSVYKLGGFGGLIIFKAVILGMAFLITVRHASADRNTQKIQKARISPVLDRVETRSGEGQRAGISDFLTVRSSDVSGAPSFPSVLKLSIAMILITLSVNMMADRLMARPEIFGYLLFSLLFWILNKSYIDGKRSLLIYITPVIILLWVNLHISFIFGLILVWLWLGSLLIKKGVSFAYAKETPYQKTILAMPVISTLATFLNPAGLRGTLMPFSIMKDYGYTIVENMTPFFLRAFKPQPEYWIYALILLATIILGVVRGFGGIGVFRGITLLVFSVFPLIAVRHLAFFALTVAPVLTPLLAVKFRKLNSDWKFAKLPILVAGSLLVAAVTNPVPLAYAKLPPAGMTEDKRHEEAVKFVKNHDLPRQGRGKPGKMWNNYDIGSYLEWSLPQHQTFVDGRPEAFPAEFFQETYIPMQESRQKWDEVVEKYDIQWVFAALTDATPWFGKWRAMIGRHEGWKVVYIDNATAILVKQN